MTRRRATRRYRVSGLARRARGPRSAARPRCSSPRPSPTRSPARRARVNAVGVLAEPGTSPAALRARLQRAARCRRRGARQRPRAPSADSGDAARAPTASARSPSSAPWAGSPAPSRCSSSPARSRSRSPSAGARRRCCARSARRRARCGRLIAARGADRVARRRRRSACSAGGAAGGGDRRRCSPTTAPRRTGSRPGRLVDPARRRRGGDGHRRRAARRDRGRPPGRAGSARPRRCARWRSSMRARAPCRSLAGLLCLGGGGAMAIIFSGEAAQRVRDPRRHAARRPAPRCSDAGCSGCPPRRSRWPLRRLGRAGPAREHEPGGQPLAHAPRSRRRSC